MKFYFRIFVLWMRPKQCLLVAVSLKFKKQIEWANKKLLSIFVTSGFSKNASVTMIICVYIPVYPCVHLIVCFMCALLCTAVFLSFEHQLGIYWYIAHLTETKPKVKEINIDFQKKSIENQFSLIFFLIYFHGTYFGFDCFSRNTI